MFDNLNIIAHIPNEDIPKNVWNNHLAPFVWRGLEFFPSQNYSFKATKLSLKEKDLLGLDITFRHGQTGQLHIRNSFHKIFESGFNHTDFTKSDFEFTVQYIGDVLGANLENAKLVGKLETGVNISIANPEAIYSNQIKYKHVQPLKMLGKGKVYGTKFYLSAYSIKTYDPILKSKIEGLRVQKIENNPLRFEVVTEMAELRRKVQVSKVKDLYQESSLDFLGERLFTIAKSIQYLPHIPNDLDLPLYLAYLYAIHGKEGHKKHLRKNKKSTYYRHHNKHKIVLKEHCDSQLDISQKVKSKWLELSSS